MSGQWSFYGGSLTCPSGRGRSEGVGRVICFAVFIWSEEALHGTLTSEGGPFARPLTDVPINVSVI